MPLKQENNIVHQNVLSALYMDSFDQGQFLWIGTNGGLLRFNKSTNQFLQISTSPQNAIRQILSYEKGKLLVGSWDGGVFLVNRETLLKPPIIGLTW